MSSIGYCALEFRQIHFNRLRRACEVADAEDDVVLVLAQIHQYFAVCRDG